MKIRCSKCEYARQNKQLSEYYIKRCKGCELDKDCTCGRKVCNCGNGCKYRNTDEICPKQVLKWAAIQCKNPDSEFHGCLLNVTANGEMQSKITWGGCAEGVEL